MQPEVGVGNTPVRLAINGYGRIGRCFLRALQASPDRQSFQIVLINEPADLASMAYLTAFDSTHGRFNGTVEAGTDALIIDGQQIAVTHARTPESVAWADHRVDCVVECSGVYGRRADLDRFVASGCPRLLLSHPGHSAEDVDATIVYGLNQQTLTGHETLVSAASCTTNAVVLILDALDRAFGVEQGMLTTLHSVMNDQPLIDGYHHDDLRRTRSAMQSIIPVSTGLARGVERLLPALKGRVQAKAIRVPTLNVSAIDMTLQVGTEVDAGQINQCLQGLAEGDCRGLVAYSQTAHASIDFNHDPHSVIVDGSQTQVLGKQMVNVFLWFDNEWGFANRMLDVLACWRFGK